MSYEQTKIKPLPLTWKTLPKYAKFISKYGKTPSQYIKEQGDKNISSLRHLDALQFSKLEKDLGSRHNLSAIPKNKGEEEMKTVTYFNTDLKKNVTVKIPAHMNIIPVRQGNLPMTFRQDRQDTANKEKDKYVLTLDEKELLDHQDLYSLIDRYSYKATGGKSKSKKNKSKSKKNKSKSKKNKSKSKKNDSFNKIKNSIESGHTLVFNNKDKLSNRQVKQLLQIAINKGDYKRAEMISFFT